MQSSPVKLDIDPVLQPTKHFVSNPATTSHYLK